MGSRQRAARCSLPPPPPPLVVEGIPLHQPSVQQYYHPECFKEALGVPEGLMEDLRGGFAHRASTPWAQLGGNAQTVLRELFVDQDKDA